MDMDESTFEIWINNTNELLHEHKINWQLDELNRIVDSIEWPNIPDLTGRIIHWVETTLVLSLAVSRSAKEKIQQAFKSLFFSICSLQGNVVVYKWNSLIRQQIDSLLGDNALRSGLIKYRKTLNIKNICSSLVHWTVDYPLPSYDCKQVYTHMSADAVWWNIYVQFCNALGKNP